MQKLTGHPKVDAISQIHFEGNLICNSWFSHLQYTNAKGTYTHHLAVLLLADIVYWYRASEVRDEDSGATTGWKKKFKSDKLQKTYKAFATQLGASIKQIREACRFLQAKGLITLEFLTVERLNDNSLGNVMFIDINPEAIAEISYRQGFTTLLPKWVIGGTPNGPYPITEMGNSYCPNGGDITETTTQTSSEISSKENTNHDHERAREKVEPKLKPEPEPELKPKTKEPEPEEKNSFSLKPKPKLKTKQPEQPDAIASVAKPEPEPEQPDAIAVVATPNYRSHTPLSAMKDSLTQMYPDFSKRLYSAAPSPLVEKVDLEAERRRYKEIAEAFIRETKTG